MSFPGAFPAEDRAVLGLSDGSFFMGYLIGVSQQVVAECVFQTSMTGYQEILTDPSYAQQLVVFTYPHIGNVGINFDDGESESMQAAACVLAHNAILPSNYRQQISFQDYLLAENKTALVGVDTRSLTNLLRSKGALNACILPGGDADSACNIAKNWPGISGLDLSSERSCQQGYSWDKPSYNLNTINSNIPNEILIKKNNSESKHIVVVDYGVKRQILRLLVDNNCAVSCVPAKSSMDYILSLKPDGVLLSNGPGDPAACVAQQKVINDLLEKTDLPIMGICLGFQLLALACGAKSYKMAYGHHGANHPVKDISSGDVYITSQNHGFAIAAESLPEYIRPTHRSLFDGSLQGIAFKDRAVVGVQGHPEASPGPNDFAAVLHKWIGSITHAEA